MENQLERFFIFYRLFLPFFSNLPPLLTIATTPSHDCCPYKGAFPSLEREYRWTVLELPVSLLNFF